MPEDDYFSLTRVLPWESSLNTRELGGYPAKEGRLVRWKALVRSETTSLLNPRGQQALRDYGIRTVIDLRYPSELVKLPSPFEDPAAQDGLDYLNIPLDTDQDLVWPADCSPGEAMSDLYLRLLESNRGHVAAVLSATAFARPGGVLFHCHAGKDRTGLISAMILGTLGVPDEIIVRDYAFAHPLYKERGARELLSPELTPGQRDFYRVLSSQHPETMALTLTALQRRYGGVPGYLNTSGLNGDALKALRARLLDGQRELSLPG